MAEQIKALNIGEVTHVASLNNTHQYIESFVEVMKPKGKLALIDDQSLDVAKLKQKSLSLHWEFMLRAQCLKPTIWQSKAAYSSSIAYRRR